MLAKEAIAVLIHSLGTEYLQSIFLDLIHCLYLLAPNRMNPMRCDQVMTVYLFLCVFQGINGILADEMGLGKTVQSIALLAHLAEVSRWNCQSSSSPEFGFIFYQQ